MTKTTKIKEVYKVTTCTRCKARIYQRGFDYDLNSFDIYTDLDEYKTTIYPSTIEEMEEIKQALKNGECPLCDSWEDGLGNTLGHQAE